GAASGVSLRFCARMVVLREEFLAVAVGVAAGGGVAAGAHSGLCVGDAAGGAGAVVGVTGAGAVADVGGAAVAGVAGGWGGYGCHGLVSGCERGRGGWIGGADCDRGGEPRGSATAVVEVEGARHEPPRATGGDAGDAEHGGAAGEATVGRDRAVRREGSVALAITGRRAADVHAPG